MSVIKKKGITITKAKDFLDKEDLEEMAPLQRVVHNYTTKFSKLDLENSEKLVEELINKAALEPETSIQIANCLPKSQEEIRTILGRQRIISEENLKRILDILKRHGDSG